MDNQRFMDIGRAVLRGVVGPLFVGHGTQKLFGWFGGHGPEGTGGFFESLGLRPGKRHALAAGAAESLGGVLVTLGFLTPLGATMITATMITAIRKVHAAKGPWVTEGGFEYNAVLIAAMTMLVEHGPGRPSVDEALFPRMKGPLLATLMLGSAAAGSYLATERFNEPAPPEAAPARDEQRFTHEEAAEAAPTGGATAPPA
ncbi:MAG TPA: DoxX family protein [Solirubrobacteraceae bacterium]|nr:DoxX family protein [Solirubrobacteraceae bacterium]